ncbi:MAG TPA: biotin transporter BioY [Corynebacterium sp.]|nr:biotin transporter BioY [Corynebacterium sp.]
MTTAPSNTGSRRTAADLAYVAVFAALIVALAFISIPVGAAGIPIVLQNAAIVLAGLILGPRRAFLAVLLFLALGLIGFPVLAGGRTTLAALAGPTVGYLAGYALSAWAAGALAYRAPARRRRAQLGWFTLATVIGLLIQYACGILGLMWRAGLDLPAAILAQAPFLVPDILKFTAMVIIAAAVHAAFPDLLSRKRR